MNTDWNSERGTMAVAAVESGSRGRLAGVKSLARRRARALLIVAILISSRTSGVSLADPDVEWAPVFPAVEPGEQSGRQEIAAAIAHPDTEVTALELPGPAVGKMEEPEPNPPRRCSIPSLLAAMAEVESANDPGAVGDGGRAIGPYQIHRAYWRDSGMRGRWTHCRDAQYARRVMLAYWLKYCPTALEDADIEVLARIHNGGPLGHTRDSTLRYWRRVQACLDADSRP